MFSISSLYDQFVWFSGRIFLRFLSNIAIKLLHTHIFFYLIEHMKHYCIVRKPCSYIPVSVKVETVLIVFSIYKNPVLIGTEIGPARPSVKNRYMGWLKLQVSSIRFSMWLTWCFSFLYIKHDHNFSSKPQIFV